MEIALGLFAVVALVAANGYFVLGEFAFVAARREQVEAAAAGGDRRARTAAGVLERLSFMLSGAQLGITVTSLLVGFIAEPVFVRALEPVLDAVGVGATPAARTGIALTVGLVLSTSLQMVFGELAPKNLGIARPEACARAVARSTAAYLAVAGPVIRLFDGSANRLLQALGVDPVDELAGGVGADELGLIVEESGRDGVLTPAQADLLGRVLDFRNLDAADVMVPRPQMTVLPHDATGEDLRLAAVATGHSRFPVLDADAEGVLGLAQAKDVLAVDAAARATTPLRDLVSPALLVPERAPVRPLLAELRRRHTSMAVVVDEYGQTAGLLTLEDLVEELVGEIRDEHDPDEPEAERLSDGTFGVPGSFRIDEVARACAVTLPDGPYETVSGLVMARLGRVPVPGDRVAVDGAQLVVEALDGHAVARVRLTPPPVEDPGGEAS